MSRMQRHLLAISDLSDNELDSIVGTADLAQSTPRNEAPAPTLNGTVVQFLCWPSQTEREQDPRISDYDWSLISSFQEASKRAGAVFSHIVPHLEIPPGDTIDELIAFSGVDEISTSRQVFV